MNHVLNEPPYKVNQFTVTVQSLCDTVNNLAKHIDDNSNNNATCTVSESTNLADIQEDDQSLPIIADMPIHTSCASISDGEFVNVQTVITPPTRPVLLVSGAPAAKIPMSIKQKNMDI